MTANALLPLIIEAIPTLRSYAMVLTKSRVDADDLVQDTLESAWKHQETFVAGGNVQAWLFAILRNRFIDEYRKQKRSPFVEDVDGMETAELASQPPQVWRLEYEEALRAIYALSPDMYAAMNLTVVKGLTCAEAAAVLKCPVGTLKSRIRLARRKLQKAKI